MLGFPRNLGGASLGVASCSFSIPTPLAGWLVGKGVSVSQEGGSREGWGGLGRGGGGNNKIRATEYEQ